jgi:hypothetical protein
MFRGFIDFFSLVNRSACRISVIVGLFFGCALMPVFAQRPNDTIVQPGMDRIDRVEGVQRLKSFRQQRLEGDYVFEFELEHKPRRARTTRYDGIMWGTWNAQGALTRIRLFGEGAEMEEGGEPASTDWIIQSGPEPKAWIRPEGKTNFQLIEGSAIFEPLLEGLSYSIFDLQMPFVYWSDFEYEGPKLVGASRVAQTFLMFPSEDSPSREQGIHGVRIGLDDTYNALLRIEVIGEADEERSRFQVESVKKVQEQYIVKKITLTNYPSKDRTTFHVTDASVGIELDASLFEPVAPSP